MIERAGAWLRDAVAAAALILEQSFLSLRNNWGIGLLSVVLAVSLWVYITEREDTVEAARVSGTVPVECVNPPPGLTVFPPCDESVSVRVRAPESVLENLTAQDFRAIADLSSAAGPEATVSVRVESEESRAEVVDFTPEEITVGLENVITRTVPVEFEALGGLPRGLRLGTVELSVEEADVTGPERLVRDVAAVRADVNLTGARTNFEQRVPLQATTAAGTPIEDIEIEPDSVVATVEVTQVEFSLGLLVRPIISGIPASGHEVTGIEWNPTFITVTGAAEVLQSIDIVQGIETDVVSIDDATSDVTRTVSLRLPEGVTADQTAVTVTVSIDEAQSRLPFPLWALLGP
ncbi:MAG: CdaR family protein [Dehalococcoidia bacterium]|nr:CdaR family protein [Dehalococcoidia bacterium]